MRRKIKFVILLAGGRSGSSLLQSLFDMHPQILQFPGDFRFDHLFVDILNEKDPEKMSQMFCDLNPFFSIPDFKKIPGVLIDIICWEKIKMNFITLVQRFLKNILFIFTIIQKKVKLIK